MRLPIELVASLWNLASGLVPTPPSSTSKGVLSSSTRTYLDDLRARYGVAGASISVVVSPKYREGGRWGEEVLSLGVADGKGSKVDEDSLFAIASNSKLLTALSVGLLIENRTRLPGGGYLDWDTKITDILPPEEWTLQDGYASDHVDITDLASMRSGMPSHNLAHVQAPRYLANSSDLPAVENVKNMRNLRPTSEIREVWQYNNMHYYTLAHIVSVLSGKDYTAYVHEHILDPLNMTRTSYNVTTARSWGGLTDGFLHYNGNGTQCAEESPDSKHISPACIGTAKPIGWWNTGDCVSEAGPGGIVTCARDGVKWLRELLEPRILPPSVLAKLATPVMYSGVPSASRHLSAEMYGMAQAVVSYRGHEVVYHTGGLPGQSSIILRAPNDGVAIAIFTNDENFILPFYYTAAYRILDDVLGLDEPGLIEDALFAQMVSLVAPKQKLAGDAPAPVQVEGRYTDKGYGSLNVTKLRNKELHDLLIPQFAYNLLPTDRPIYVSAYDRLFTDYMVFTHANASTWHIAIAKIHWYDTRKGEQVFGLDFESTPEERGGAVPIVAAFGAGVAVVTDNGIGVFGGFSSPGPLAKLSPPVEEDVETRAEVWFKKVKSVA